MTAADCQRRRRVFRRQAKPCRGAFRSRRMNPDGLGGGKTRTAVVGDQGEGLVRGRPEANGGRATGRPDDGVQSCRLVTTRAAGRKECVMGRRVPRRLDAESPQTSGASAFQQKKKHVDPPAGCGGGAKRSGRRGGVFKDGVERTGPGLCQFQGGWSPRLAGSRSPGCLRPAGCTVVGARMRPPARRATSIGRPFHQLPAWASKARLRSKAWGRRRQKAGCTRR